MGFGFPSQKVCILAGERAAASDLLERVEDYARLHGLGFAAAAFQEADEPPVLAGWRLCAGLLGTGGAGTGAGLAASYDGINL